MVWGRTSPRIIEVLFCWLVDFSTFVGSENHCHCRKPVDAKSIWPSQFLQDNVQIANPQSHSFTTVPCPGVRVCEKKCQSTCLHGRAAVFVAQGLVLLRQRDSALTYYIHYIIIMITIDYIYMRPLAKSRQQNTQ